VESGFTSLVLAHELQARCADLCCAVLPMMDVGLAET